MIVISDKEAMQMEMNRLRGELDGIRGDRQGEERKIPYAVSEAAAMRDVFQMAMYEHKDRAEAAEARCTRLEEARERANEAAHQWEGRCKILETRLETAEKMVKEYQDELIPGYRERAERAEREAKEAQREATICRNGWKKAEREKDAAVSDIETILAYGDVNLDTCQYCKNGQCYARGGTKPCFPKWRG